MFSITDSQALFLTLQLASVTTFLLLIFSFPLAWWLANTQHRYKVIVEAVVALPLVLPPTVLGFYFLIAFNPDGSLGQLLTALGLPTLTFSFTGLVIGSFFYSLPFVVQPLQNSFQQMDRRYIQIAASLGANRLRIIKEIILPLIKPGVITAAVLGFAHTVGEFGVVLMIGGNIPGETQVLSIAIFEHVEAFEYQQAHVLSLGLLLSSLVVLILVYRQNNVNNKKLRVFLS